MFVYSAQPRRRSKRRTSRPHFRVPAATWTSTSNRVRWAALWAGAVMLSRGHRTSGSCVEKTWKRPWRVCNRILYRKQGDQYGPSSFPWKRMTLALDQGKVCPHPKARGSLSHWLTVVKGTRSPLRRTSWALNAQQDQTSAGLCHLISLILPPPDLSSD